MQKLSFPTDALTKERRYDEGSVHSILGRFGIVYRHQVGDLGVQQRLYFFVQNIDNS